MCEHKQSPQTLIVVDLDPCRASKTSIRHVMNSNRRQETKPKEAKSNELKTIIILKLFKSLGFCQRINQ